MTTDPYVREIGRLTDGQGRIIAVGVDHGTVTLCTASGGITLASVQAEDFARLYVSACWQAARQAATLAQSAELRAAAEEIQLTRGTTP